jgi:hypothetical protein
MLLTKPLPVKSPSSFRVKLPVLPGGLVARFA